MESQDLTSQLLPLYKHCKKCDSILLKTDIIKCEPYFYCNKCHMYTKWCHNTMLTKMQIPLTQLQKLLAIFLNGKTPSEAFHILHYDFVNEDICQTTIINYYDRFNRILMEYYLTQLDTILLEGEVEIDESHLFKQKVSSAPHRQYASHAVWLFGLCKRKSSDFFFTSFIT